MNSYLQKYSSYIGKIEKKLKETSGKLFPYNNFYRPAGIYETSKDFINAVKNKETHSQCIEIYPDLVTDLAVSDEFYKSIAKLLIPVKSATTTYVVTVVENGRLYTDYQSTIAIISEDNHLIGDVSFTYNKRRVGKAKENPIFKQQFFKKPQHYKGVVFEMLSGQGARENYGHWLIDVLPRLHLLKESGWFDKVDYFLVPNYTYSYHKDSLQLLGIDAGKIIPEHLQMHIQADILIASTAPRGNYSLFPQWACDFLRTSYLNENILSSNYPPLVYVSRRDSSIRRVLNEDKVIELLSTYGFKTYVLSELSFIEKVKLFASAHVLVSATGAGMANAAFCRKDAKMLEIFGKGFVHHETYDLANKVGFEYYYLITKEDTEADKTSKIHNQHVTVNINELRHMLDKMLSIQQEPLNHLSSYN